MDPYPALRLSYDVMAAAVKAPELRKRGGGRRQGVGTPDKRSGGGRQCVATAKDAAAGAVKTPGRLEALPQPPSRRLDGAQTP